MKQIIAVLLVCGFWSCVMPEEPEVGELVPGELIGANDNTYYQEYDLKQGSHSVEGVIDLSTLSQKTDDIGYPVLSISYGLYYEKSVPDGNGGTIGEHVGVPGLPSIHISPNIETGYYKISGLPDVTPVVDADAGEIAGQVGLDIVDTAMDKERFFIRTFYSPDNWNSTTTTRTISSTSYVLPDPSITFTVDMVYMVDDYWLANGEFEIPDAGADYTEHTYEQIAALGSIGAGEDGTGGLVFINREHVVEGVSRGMVYSPTRREYQNQQFTVNRLAGGTYADMTAAITIDGTAYTSERKSFRGGLLLESNDSVTRTIEIFVPEQIKKSSK